MKISCRRAVFFFALINPILSLMLDNTSIYYFYLMGPIVFLLLIYYNCKHGTYGRMSLFVTIATVFSVLTAIAYGASKSDLGKINNHLFSFLDTVLLLLMLSKDENVGFFKSRILERLNIIKWIVIIINVVEAYLLFTRNGYEYRYSWGGNFFHGTNSMPHTLSYLMLVVIILDCLVIKYTKKRIYGFFSIVPFYAIFESGARTTLLLSAFLLLIVIDLIFTQKQKSVMLKVLFVLLFASCLAYLLRDKIFSSDLWNKITLRQASGNDTAGRTYIWADLIQKYFASHNPIKYLLGQGDQMTYTYNLANDRVKASVWAHNDFLQILIGKGLVGLICYVYALIKCVKNIVVKNKNVYKYAVVCMIVLAAAINGFYSYRDIMLSLPFMAVLARYYGDGGIKDEQYVA